MPRKIQMPKGQLGPNFTKKILPWVEVFWHSHKRYPTDTELSAEFGFNADDLMRLKASKFYNECLKNRGISQNVTFFTEKQVAAIALITNFTDNRPVDSKLAGIGVTPEMYNGWMQNPAFKRELQSRADDILDNVYPEAQAALAKKVRTGDMAALKFYFEITGRASSPETINLKMTMARMIEAVQKHVKDPAVLQAIASELSSVAPVADIPSTPIPALSMKQSYMEHSKEKI
jgi:hypothetical protein